MGDRGLRGWSKGRDGREKGVRAKDSGKKGKWRGIGLRVGEWG